MRKSGICLLSCALLFAIFANLPSAKAEIGMEIGDFWVYGTEGASSGIEFNGSLKYEIKDSTTSGGVDVFEVEISGSGEVMGVVESLSASGSIEFQGYEYRSVESYDILAQNMIMTMEFEVLSMSMTMIVGVESEYSEGLDSYIGDDNLTVGNVVETSLTITSDSWMNIMGMNETESTTFDQVVTMTVVAVDVDVSVPAGDFVCTKVAVAIDNDVLGTQVQYWYYNDEVMNYVKMEGEDILGIGAASVELTDYNTGESGGILGSLTGDNLWVLILIVAVVVVLVVVLTIKRRGKKQTPYVSGQAEPGMVPSPPMEPVTPADTPPNPPPPPPTEIPPQT